MNTTQKIFSVIFFVFACSGTQGCIAGEGCAVPDQSTDYVDSKWIKDTDPEALAYKFKCTGDVWPKPDLTGGKSVGETIELVMKDVYTGRAITVAIARGNALALAKQRFAELVKLQNPGTYTVDGIVCEEKWMKQPPIGTCKVSDNDSSGSPAPAPTTDPGPYDPGPGPSGEQPQE